MMTVIRIAPVSLVLAGHRAVAVERDGRVHLVPFKHRRDLLGLLFEVHGDELNALLAKLFRDLLHLRHRLQARAAPGGPEVEHHDVSLGIRQVERLGLRPQKPEREIWQESAREGGLGAARRVTPPRSSLRTFGSRSVARFPLKLGELRRGLFDRRADQGCSISLTGTRQTPSTSYLPERVAAANRSASNVDPHPVTPHHLHPPGLDGRLLGRRRRLRQHFLGMRPKVIRVTRSRE